MKRVLVTGASGFIGRFTLPALVARGYDVHVADLRPPDTALAFTFHSCDLLAAEQAARVIEAVQPTHLLHLAWYAVPGLYWEAAENLAFLSASTSLLEPFRKSGGKRIVMVGSCAEYDWDSGYCTENVTPLAPSTLYGVCKDALRRVSQRHAALHGLSWAWARQFFLYGPHEHPSRLVASIIASMLAGKPANMTHGRQVRDFMHVDDVGGALAALLDSDVAGPVNIASGTPVTLGDMASELASLLGTPDLLRLGALNAPAREPPLLVGNARRLHEEVGFAPRYDLTSGLAATIDWWRSARQG